MIRVDYEWSLSRQLVCGQLNIAISRIRKAANRGGGYGIRTMMGLHALE